MTLKRLALSFSLLFATRSTSAQPTGSISTPVTKDPQAISIQGSRLLCLQAPLRMHPRFLPAHRGTHPRHFSTGVRTPARGLFRYRCRCLIFDRVVSRPAFIGRGADRKR